MLREMKSTQRLNRTLAFRVDGTGTASILEGVNDAVLTDNGTGDYTLTFAKPFARVPVVVAVGLAADIVMHVAAVSKLAVQIKARSVAAIPAAADVDFHAVVMGFDSVDQT